MAKPKPSRLKVKGKTFVFMRDDANGVSFSVKVPQRVVATLPEPPQLF